MTKMAAAALGAALLAGGCADGGITYGANYTPRFQPSEVEYAASRGAIPVSVRGNPLALPKPQFDEAVVGAMQGNTFGRDIRFGVAPPGAPTSGYRVVMAFDDTATGRADLCQAGERPAGPGSAGTVHAEAAFCLDIYLLSEVQGRVSGVTGPTDRRLRAMIAQMTLELLPTYDANLWNQFMEN